MPAMLSPNILVFNGHFPVFPGTGGHEFLNTTNLARFAPNVGLVSMVHAADAASGSGAFHERGVDLFLWRGPDIDAKPRYCRPPGLLHRLHARVAGAVHSLKALPARPRDAVVADLDFRNMAGPLIQALNKRHWNVLVVVQSSSAAVLDYVPKPDVSALVMHDIRSLVFSRQADVASSPWQRTRLRRQARLYYEFEKKYARRYDLLIALSETDAEWIRHHYQPNRIAVVSIPVDADYFAPAPLEAERPARIVFTGLMQHPPNVDAAVYFAREVFPAIRAQVPAAEFFVVGKYPAPEVLALAALPGVTVTGSVPDTRPYLAEASVVVVPLRFGSGVRNKILEAWSMEKCVVSTTLGAEGLSCEDGVNLAIADGPDAMARSVLHGLHGFEYRRRLGTAGRQVAVARHDPKLIAEGYYTHLRRTATDNLQHAPMRVALDMRWLTPGLAGGLENLARSFMRHLIVLDRHNSYTMIVPARCRYDFDLRGCRNFRVTCRDSVKPAACHLLWQGTQRLHATLRLDYRRSPDVVSLEFLRSLDAEIVYSFPGYIHPEMLPLPQVLMVPDIQHEYLPELFSETALRERRRIYTESIRRADHICAISEFTRQTLIERLHVAPEKITTVLLAADPVFRTTSTPAADRARLAKYRLPEDPFLFFPAHTWRHKNHKAAIAALVLLRDRYRMSPLLVCTGGTREAQPELEEQIHASGLVAQVRFLGYCPQEDLPALYRTAACLVFPSLFEGFGIPVLEAMACSCPVVCSNTTSLPEIAGDAALLVDPADPEALAAALRSVLLDGELRERLAALGLQQASRFSWRRHTLETVAVLHRVHQQLRSGSTR